MDRTAWRGVGAELLAGLVTALFSVPEGIAYAAMAGFEPAAGLYAGVVPAALGSLLSATPVLVTTLTTAVALTSRTALQQAQLTATPGNVAALALLVGVAMAVLALLRVDALLRRVRPAALTGFSAGIAVQIVAGALPEATGYHPHRHNPVLRILLCAAHPHGWERARAVAAVATVLVWLAVFAVRRVRALAVPVALAATSAGVCWAHLPVPSAASLGPLPSGLPALTVPCWPVLPRLALGAAAVALVALAQAAGVAAPGQQAQVRRRWGHDVWAQAAANLAGAFCQAMPAGGSLSRTAVAVAAGGRTRWAGVSSGVALALLVAFGGRAVAAIPLPVVGALLALVGGKLLVGRRAAVGLAWRGGAVDRALLLGTLALSTEVPLTYALLAATGASLALRRRPLGARAEAEPDFL